MCNKYYGRSFISFSKNPPKKKGLFCNPKFLTPPKGKRLLKHLLSDIKRFYTHTHTYTKKHHIMRRALFSLPSAKVAGSAGERERDARDVAPPTPGRLRRDVSRRVRGYSRGFSPSSSIEKQHHQHQHRGTRYRNANSRSASSELYHGRSVSSYFASSSSSSSSSSTTTTSDDNNNKEEEGGRKTKLSERHRRRARFEHRRRRCFRFEQLVRRSRIEKIQETKRQRHWIR